MYHLERYLTTMYFEKQNLHEVQTRGATFEIFFSHNLYLDDVIKWNHFPRYWTRKLLHECGQVLLKYIIVTIYVINIFIRFSK